jgi:hypothetical protein
VVSITSCSKERLESETPKSTLTEYSNTNSYLDTKKQEEQTYTVDSPGNGPIRAQQGTLLYPYKEIFMYPNGDSVHYPFEIRIIEIYKPIDMVYSQMPTVSDNKLLTTAGEVRIRVFKDGIELVLRPNRELRIDFPNPSPTQNMRVFYGEENGSFVNWTNPNDSITFSDTISGYSVFTHRLNWINCDYFVNYSGSLANFSFSSSVDSLQTVAKFIYFDNLNSMMQLYSLTSAEVPVGEDIKIIFIGENSSNQLFYYYNDTIVNSTNSYNINLSSISETSLDSLLNTL